MSARMDAAGDCATRGDGPAPAQANQSMAVLRALFNYAIREYREPDGAPVLTDNPVDVLYKKWVPLKPRTSRVPDSKVGAVWSFLTKAREQAYNRDTLASLDLVMLLLLTGLRIGDPRIGSIVATECAVLCP